MGKKFSKQKKDDKDTHQEQSHSDLNQVTRGLKNMVLPTWVENS
jgi:hypothetical protein